MLSIETETDICVNSLARPVGRKSILSCKFSFRRSTSQENFLGIKGFFLSCMGNQIGNLKQAMLFDFEIKQALK